MKSNLYPTSFKNSKNHEMGSSRDGLKNQQQEEEEQEGRCGSCLKSGEGSSMTGSTWTWYVALENILLISILEYTVDLIAV